MPNENLDFYSKEGKRLVLVADDEFINRELMGNVLSRDYEVIYAENGKEALDLILEHKDALSLVLLDLNMPVMTGLELLGEIKKENAIKRIPVIVITSDQQSEVESLNLGAVDFIPKPYPQPEIILARVRRTIELSEDRQIILSTERDPLTGLYTREYFYRYAEQFDKYHESVPMDAIMIDVQHFHTINERFGIAYGDSLLRDIGQQILSMMQGSEGLVCRQGGDTFMIYCPNGRNYKELLDGAVPESEHEKNRVRLRMGVYANVDKSIDIVRRFDRAKRASDMARHSLTGSIEKYDHAMHEKELYSEQLIEDFKTAIIERQFKVYYQPKFDVRASSPFLTSAEALVRWEHPRLGMISPGIFVPLFESNGLIHELDVYVWHTAAAQIAEWKRSLGFSVPVSVNVSRIDVFDPLLTDIFSGILRSNGLSAGDLLLEITESAYTQESDSLKVVSTVKRLRELGFRIEMDDFGSGYSSLNMLSTLPIDALKLDMQFIRSAFKGKKDTRMLEVVIDIAKALRVPVIAEGVETEEQMLALKNIGCDVVQGYYFSKPVPAEQFERFIIERKAMEGLITLADFEFDLSASNSRTVDAITRTLCGDYETIYYVNSMGGYLSLISDGANGRFRIERTGVDFVPEVLKEMEGFSQEDVLRLSDTLSNLSELSGRSLFMRLDFERDGAPKRRHLHTVVMQDGEHLILGIGREINIL